MRTIEISEMNEILDACPTNINLLMVGDTGIGKTTIVEKYCKERNIYLKTLILSQIDASESLGIPVRSQRKFNEKTYETLVTAMPNWVFELAEHQDDGAMLFLDEFLCAQPSVMNAFLNFLSQKRVNDIDLSKVRVVAATNVGKYTFDPDNNILSRFCMFYTVNTHAADYVKEDRIVYRYYDENPRSGVIFEQRSLKPRCFEQISQIKDQNMFLLFYEGFTNRPYFVLSEDQEMNDLLQPYFEINKDGLYEVTKENCVAIHAVLSAKYPRVRNWEKIISAWSNLTVDSTILLLEVMNG